MGYNPFPLLYDSGNADVVHRMTTWVAADLGGQRVLVRCDASLLPMVSIRETPGGPERLVGFNDLRPVPVEPKKRVPWKVKKPKPAPPPKQPPSPSPASARRDRERAEMKRVLSTVPPSPGSSAAALVEVGVAALRAAGIERSKATVYGVLNELGLITVKPRTANSKLRRTDR